MKITRENYESFFLDYLENNLKEEFIDEFLDFLKQNPDLKEELNLFDHLNLPEEKIIFSGKNQLYESVSDEKAALEIRLIACLEGDMEDQERNSFEDYLANQPELQKEYNLLAKTRLAPDLAIKYPEKHRLKRKSRSVHILNWSIRIAAIVLLFWGINAVIKTGNQSDDQRDVPKIAELISKPVIQAEKAENKKPISETTIPQKLNIPVEPKPAGEQIVESTAVESPSGNQTKTIIESEPVANILAEISPKMARLESSDSINQLVVPIATKIVKSDKAGNELTIEEFLASKAKKAGDEGLLSAKRLARAGLDVASGISGERIAYVEKNGQITSIGFESKLIAFSIPLKKK